MWDVQGSELFILMTGCLGCRVNQQHLFLSLMAGQIVRLLSDIYLAIMIHAFAASRQDLLRQFLSRDDNGNNTKVEAWPAHNDLSL